MFYNKINYLLHTLLWSKYRLLINMLFILEDEANSFYDAYKKQCKISGRLGNQVGDLKQELREKNAEISQLRSSVRLLGDSLATRK